MSDETVDFGYQTVSRADKTARVRDVFDSVARRYDVMNDVMSMGLHRLWKDAFVTWLRPRAGQAVLDVAGGTGDIAFRIARASRGGAEITVADINHAMLRVGRERAGRRRSRGNRIAGQREDAAIRWVCANAETLPFADASFDAVTVAFGVRNMTDKPAALAEMRRVLRPGGRFLCLEFSRLALPGLSPVYDWYSFEAVPRMGALIARDRDSYRYLVESIRMFPDQEAFAGLLREAGLSRVGWRDLAGGIAAMHAGWRL